MTRLSRLLSVLLGLGAVAGSQAPAVAAANLAAEQKSSFFQWFNLEASCPPAAAAGGQTWHCFRPSGPQFHALVELDVLTDAQGGIVASQLGIDRTFIDSSANGVFARDIAKSYLGWAIPVMPTDFTGLIRNIADMSQAGGQVIMRQDAVRPAPPDITGGYEVYRGVVKQVALKGPGFTLDVVNEKGALPADRAFAGPRLDADSSLRWLRLTVRFVAK